jgi:hypothetical protein
MVSPFAAAAGVPVPAVLLGLAEGLDVDDEEHPANASARTASAAKGLEKRMWPDPLLLVTISSW